MRSITSNADTVSTSGAVGTISNAGVIESAAGTGIYNLGTITSLSNRRMITGKYGINNAGTISSFTNSGAIFGSDYALYNGASRVLGAITHSGSLLRNITNLSSHDLNADTELTYRAAIGQNRNDAIRSLSFASGQATASYDSVTASLGAGLARSDALSEKTRFTPSISADYTWIKEDGYRESGSSSISPLLLKVDGCTADELILAVDGKLSHRLADDKTTLNANLGIGYDVLNSDTSITSSYAGASAASFVTSGMKTRPWLARCGFGMTHQVKDSVELSARYMRITAPAS